MRVFSVSNISTTWFDFFTGYRSSWEQILPSLPGFVKRLLLRAAMRQDESEDLRLVVVAVVSRGRPFLAGRLRRQGSERRWLAREQGPRRHVRAEAFFAQR